MNREGSFVARSEKEARSVPERLQAILTEKERQILDMWPRFENGEPVMIGDGVDGLGDEIIEVYIAENAAAIWDNFGNHMHLSLGERVKRPAPEVLDADGVRILKGELVCGVGRSGHLFSVIEPYHIDPELGGAFSVWCIDLTEAEECHCRPELLAHTRPDSWEQLEEDIAKHPCVYAEDVKDGKFSKCSECPWYSECGGARASEVMARDIIRRAKALAGIEVER